MNDPEVEVRVRQNDAILERKNGGSWILSAGPGVVEITDRKTGETLVSREFLVTRNGKELVRVSLRELADARKAKDRTDQAPVKIVMKDPGTLMALQGQNQGTMSFLVTGATEGFVWGTNVYTLDSPLAKTAVHVGLLKVGETGAVEVEFVAPPPSFSGSTRNGVTSMPYGPFPGAYRFPGATPAPVVEIPFTPPPLAPVGSGGLAGLVPEVGKKHVLPARGNVTGTVWGTDVYTSDSDLGAAAVHAGKLKAGETGRVEIEFVAVPPEFVGTNRNGVVSQSFLSWPGAFRIVKATPGPIKEAELMPGPVPTLVDHASKPGKKVSIPVKGVVLGSVYGTDVYTLDSDVGAAALHAGVLKPGQTKTLEVEVLAPPPSFSGSTRNGITSVSFGFYPPGAFRFVKPEGK